MSPADIVSTSLYLLALINPVSKIFVLSVLGRRFKAAQLAAVSVRATVIAFLILAVFAAAGNLILTRVFHVQMHSFKIAAGVILFIMGVKALFKGVFFEIDPRAGAVQASIVPLASPMIAGPATITAVTTFSAEYGLAVVLTATFFALAANLGVMLATRAITKFLTRTHLMEALIRITGLVVATMAVEMVLSGVAAWLASLPAAG